MKFKAKSLGVTQLNLLTGASEKTTPLVKIIKELLSLNQTFFELDILFEEVDIFDAAKTLELRHKQNLIIHIGEYNGYNYTYTLANKENIDFTMMNIKNDCNDMEWYKNEFELDMENDYPFSIYLEPFDVTLESAIYFHETGDLFDEYIDILVEEFLIPKYKDSDNRDAFDKRTSIGDKAELHVIVLTVFLFKVIYSEPAQFKIKEIKPTKINSSEVPNYWDYWNMFNIITNYIDVNEQGNQIFTEDNFHLFIILYKRVSRFKNQF